MRRGWLGVLLCVVLLLAGGCGRNTRGSGGAILPPGNNGTNGGSDTDGTSGDINSQSDGSSEGTEDGSSGESDAVGGADDGGTVNNDVGGGQDGGSGEDIQGPDTTDELDTSEPDCVDDEDCGNGFVCSNGKCLPDQPGCTDACSPGTTKCTPDATGYVTCVPLQDGCFGWGQAKNSCPLNTSCVEGECKETAVVCPPSACLSQGAKQCAGNAVQTCQASASSPGCNEWKTTENCGAMATCQNGTCVPNEVQAGCALVFDCIEANQCESLDDSCTQACAKGSNPKAASEFSAYYSCITEQCGDVATQAEFNYCMLSSCKSAGSKCFPELGAGSGTCMTFFECAGNCPEGNDVCIASCVDDLSWDGLADVWDYNVCAENFCAGLSGNDFGNCAIQNCLSQVEKCFSLAP